MIRYLIEIKNIWSDVIKRLDILFDKIDEDVRIIEEDYVEIKRNNSNSLNNNCNIYTDFGQ